MRKVLFIIWLLPFLGFPQLENYIEYLPTSTSGIVNHHSYYSYSYLEKHRVSEWTIYWLTKDYLEQEPVTSSRNFKVDPKLINLNTARSVDYRKSGFDRGHLVPFRDMSFSKIAANESNYYSNIAPQFPGFNRGIWKKLESQFRDWVLEYDSLIIITGVVCREIDDYPKSSKKLDIFKYDIEFGKIGNVSVPQFFYKVLIDVDRKESIAFLFDAQYFIPNSEYNQPSKNLQDYIVTFSTLESLTGLDFFYKLPDEDELDFESN